MQELIVSFLSLATEAGIFCFCGTLEELERREKLMKLNVGSLVVEMEPKSVGTAGD